MILKQLKIRGFKSFADKTQIDFNQGVTAIVGPNGCGKSNILDSIRWVLGEQNPRHLRGLRMQDVIFSGTETRRSEGMAEVSLLLDNANRTFPIDYSEIVVTRRLFRSGESEYLINKSPCRLKDITELFMDTGIGKSTYSIMEQGRVEQILNSRPLERRIIFEEAAGITKYKARRDEALRKLTRTEQDLIRLTDILAELGRQVRSLKRQSSLAERYERYLEQIQALELALIARTAQKLESDSAQAEAQRQAGEDHKQALAARRATLQATLAQSAQRLSALDEQLHQLAERQISLRAEMERWDEKARGMQERREELETRGARLEQERQETEQRLDTSRRLLGERQASVEAEQQSFHRASEDASAADRRIEQLKSLVAQQYQTVEQLRQAILRLQNELTAGENDRRRIEREREIVSAQGEKLTAQQQQRSDELKRLEEALQDKESQVRQEQAGLARLENACDDASRRMEQLGSEWEACCAALSGLQSELQTKRSRLASLVELQRNFEGYKDGVKFLLQEREQEDSALKPQCMGTLAQLMSVEKGYERAVEVALAYTLQYLLVEQEAEAVRLLEALSEGDQGRAGFVALDSLSAPSAAPLPETLGDGQLRRATEVIHVPEPLQQVSQALFGDILIAPTLEQAREARRRLGNHYPVITLQGEVIDARGTLSGGSHTEGGLLSRKREITELQTLLEEIERQHAEESRRGEELKRQLDEFRKKLEGDVQQRHEIQIRLAKSEQELAALEHQKQRLLKEQDLVSQEQSQRAQELARLAEDLQTTQERLDRFQQEFHETTARFEQENALLREKQDELQQLETRRQQMAVALAEQRKDLERSRAEVENLQEQIAQLEHQVASRAEERQALLGQTEQAAQQIEQFRQRAGEILVETQQLEAQLAACREQREAAAAERAQQEADLEAIEQERRGMDERTVELESTRVRLSLEKENLARRLKNDFEKDYAEWTTFDRREERPQEEIESELESLRGRMQRLGPVNRLARAEYEELNQRFEFLGAQKEDLEKARANLLRTIAEAKRTARERFEKVFEEIRENFRKTFRTMFGGGRADLLLLDEEDIVESGIEIVAQPPGKNLQSISLLSGGEKALTAISLLFAIYLIKPSPFCILDEIDAPLDDANIGRFTQVLRQFTDRSQFLIITHNKRTMEMADVIYGVTMSENGVTEMMSMSFDRARHHAKHDYILPPVEEEQELSAQERESLVERARADTAAAEAEPAAEAPRDVPRAKNGTPLEPYTVGEEMTHFHEEDFVHRKEKQQAPTAESE